MNIYIAMIIGSTLFGMMGTRERERVGDKDSSPQFNYWVFLSGVGVFLVSALRYGIGTDYFATYVPEYYLYMSNPDMPIDWEPFFGVLYKCLVRVTHNPQWVFVITSAIVISCFWYAFFKISSIPWLSILLFFVSRQFFISLNGVRQYVGLALVCVGMAFLKEKKYAYYFAFVFLGTMCHYSTAIYFILFGLVFVVLTPVESVAVIGVFSVFSKSLYGVFRKIVLLTPYAKYIGSKYDTTSRFNSWTIFELLFVYLLVSILIERKPIQKDEQYLRFLYNMMTLCVLVSFNLYLVPNSERISWALEMPSIFLIPEVVSRIETKREKWLVSCAIIVVYSYVMYNRLLAGDHEVVPYQVIPAISVLFYA